MNETNLIFAIVAMVIGILVTRWVFKIDKLAHHMETQTSLLGKIAQQLGVSPEEVAKSLGKKIRLQE